LFAAGKYGLAGPTGAVGTSTDGLSGTIDGLFWGGGTTQLVAQIKGSATITIATLAVGFALMYAVKLTRTLRVSAEGEMEGLDIHEHGGPAYHVEFGMGTSYTTMSAGGDGPVPAPASQPKQSSSA
jgi:Amt family ammonium transporter